jgi:predicted nucleic acid-binding protein
MRGSSAVVVDASAVFALIKNEPAAPALRKRLFERDLVFYAPAVIDLEILSTARRYVFRGEMTLAEADTLFAAYASIDILRYAHDSFFFRIWDFRDNFTAYDAAYVALAEAYRVPLITLDARLAKSAPRTIRVELFA